MEHNNAFIGNIIHEIVFYCKQIQSISPHTRKKTSTHRLRVAIASLQHQTIETRLNAIDELAQLAHDAPQHHWLIMEVLSNFIRAHVAHISPAQLNTNSTPPIRAEIQAALTVISQRNIKQDPENQQLDLSHIDIRGANLSKANLEEANFYRVNLAGANLSEANLCGTILSAANLRGANLAGANLSGSILSAANLAGANLTGANLEQANLYLANLQGATLHETMLHGANLREVKITTTDINNGNSSRIEHQDS